MKIQSDKTLDPSKDILGRKSMASEIASGLIKYTSKQKDCLTLSITGNWGSGKSTLLSFVKDELISNEDCPFSIIEFNPWMFYKNESIKEAFLVQLALALNDFEAKTDLASKKLREMIKAFRWLKYINATAGNIQSGLESLTESFSDYRDIHEIKNDIEKILLKRKKKILVIIDDIDRLLPDQITEVFQVISLVTNFSNIVYILSFDREIVIESINKSFNGKGQDYLEKVIQVDYELPSIPDEKLEKLFLVNISELEKEYKIKVDSYAVKSLWNYHGLKHYFTNIRDFKRFFNSLMFRLPSIAADVNTTDFLAIEAIRIFDYASYTRFYDFYKNNARRRELPESGLNKEQFDALNPLTTEILKALSPKSTLHSLRHDASSKRLLSPAYFDRYFTLVRNDGDISEKDFREIIARAEQREKILKETVTYDRIKNLIERLDDRSLYKTNKNYDYSLIADLIAFFNDHTDIFEKYSDRVSNMLINLICSPRENFIKKFFSSFTENIYSPSVVHVYFFHYIRLFAGNGNHFRTDHSIFDQYYKENYSTIEDAFLPIFKKMSSFIIQPDTTKNCPFVKYLYQLNYASLFPNDYDALLKQILQEKEYVLYLAQMIIKLDSNSNNLSQFDFTMVPVLFPGNHFLNFHSLICKLAPETLKEREKIVCRYMKSLDISEYPKIKNVSGQELMMKK